MRILKPVTVWCFSEYTTADSREVLCGSSRTLSGLASTEEDLSQDSVEEHSSSEEYTVNTESDEECLDKVCTHSVLPICIIPFPFGN